MRICYCVADLSRTRQRILKENHEMQMADLIFFKMENIIDVITQVTAFVSVIYINKQNIHTSQKIDFSFQLHNNVNIKEIGR